MHRVPLHPKENTPPTTTTAAEQIKKPSKVSVAVDPKLVDWIKKVERDKYAHPEQTYQSRIASLTTTITQLKSDMALRYEEYYEQVSITWSW